MAGENTVDEMALQQQTKQVILEYFSLIPDDDKTVSEFDINNEAVFSNMDNIQVPTTPKLNVPTITVTDMSEAPSPEPEIFNRSTSLRFENCQKDLLKPRRSNQRFHTHTIDRTELGLLLQQIAAHTTTENGKIFARSKSFESRKYYLAMRKKMQQLLFPLVKNNSKQDNNTPLHDIFDKSLTQDINNLDYSHLEGIDNVDSGGKRRKKRCVSSCLCKKRLSRKRLSVTIPQRPPNHWWSPTLTNRPLVSANTYAVNLLEEISQDIMATFPNVLSEAINDLLTPLQESNEISYEVFSSVVKPVLTLRLQGVVTTIWHKVSLVMTLIKETMVTGKFDDHMMEVMVDYSTKFFMENIVQSVEEEGGWDILTFDELMCCHVTSSCGDDVTGGHRCPCDDVTGGGSSSELATNGGGGGGVNDVAVCKWLPLGLVLVTIGLGFLFQRMR